MGDGAGRVASDCRGARDVAPDESFSCPWLLRFGLLGARSLPREGRRKDERKECGDLDGVGNTWLRKFVSPVSTVRPAGLEVFWRGCTDELRLVV